MGPGLGLGLGSGSGSGLELRVVPPPSELGGWLWATCGAHSWNELRSGPGWWLGLERELKRVRVGLGEGWGWPSLTTTPCGKEAR